MKTDLLTAKILLEVGNHIINKLDEAIPKRERELRGNCKKAYEDYVKTIIEDKNYIKKAKDILKEDKLSELELLDSEMFYAECLFTYIQNNYYLKPKIRRG